MASEDWNVVGRKGKTKRPPEKRTTAPAPVSEPSSIGRDPGPVLEAARRPGRLRSPEEQLQDLRVQVEAAKEEILRSDFWRHAFFLPSSPPAARWILPEALAGLCRELQRRMQQTEEDAMEAAGGCGCATWDSIRSMLVLGLGSPRQSPAPRHQLALALLLADGLEQLQRPIRARDPCFSELDRRLLTDLGFQVLETDEEAFRRIEEPTLAFLPHCPASMNHNLAAANWAAGALRQLAVIGNSFVAMAEAWKATPRRLREDTAEPAAVLALVAAGDAVDTPVSECRYPVRGAFNDLSVMLFPTFTAEQRLKTVEALNLAHLLPRPD